MIQFYEAKLDDIDAPKAWYARNNAFLPHFHESIELIYVLEGASQAIIDGDVLNAAPGQMIIAGSYQVHSYIQQESYVIVAAIPLSCVPGLEGQLSTRQFRTSLVTDDVHGSLGQMMQLLVSFRGMPAAQAGLSAAILGYLIDQVGLSPTARPGLSDLPRRVLGYIGEHYEEAITSSQLAAHFGYSRSRFAHLFKASIGYSLPAYLHMVRLRRVAALLATTSLPIAEIAAQCGYPNPHTFHYAFRNHFGMPPSEYRRLPAHEALS